MYWYQALTPCLLLRRKFRVFLSAIFWTGIHRFIYLAFNCGVFRWKGAHWMVYCSQKLKIWGRWARQPFRFYKSYSICDVKSAKENSALHEAIWYSFEQLCVRISGHIFVHRHPSPHPECEWHMPTIFFPTYVLGGSCVLVTLRHLVLAICTLILFFFSAFFFCVASSSSTGSPCDRIFVDLIFSLPRFRWGVKTRIFLYANIRRFCSFFKSL